MLKLKNKCKHNFIIEYRDEKEQGLQCDKCREVQPFTVEEYKKSSVVSTHIK